MKATIVGLERVNYPKKDGTEVDSHIFHLSRNDMNVVGQCSEQVYMTTKQLNNLGAAVCESDYDDLIGTTINVDYNAKGRVCGFELDVD